MGRDAANRYNVNRLFRNQRHNITPRVQSAIYDFDGRANVRNDTQAREGRYGVGIVR